MSTVDINNIYQFVQENIGSFHEKRLERLNQTNLDRLLKRKNPYLFRAKYMMTAQDLVTALLDAGLSSSEETLFGDFLERLAIFINGIVYGGVKSNRVGVDLEFEKNDTIYIVEIKSGPNWGNSSQIARMKTNFRREKEELKAEYPDQEIVAVNGCCYGKDNRPDKGEYLKYCGQMFWSFISGDDDLYTDIIEPLGHKAKEKNEFFCTRRAQIINVFTREFIDDFCDAGGMILWEKLVKFNSQASLT